MQRFNAWLWACVALAVILCLVFWPVGEKHMNHQMISYHSDMPRVLSEVNSTKGTLFLGSSESCNACNLVSALQPTSSRPLFLLARSGLSPWVSAILLSRMREGLDADTSVVWLLNPVYFLKAQNRLEWSWLQGIVGDRTAVIDALPALHHTVPQVATFLEAALRGYGVLKPFYAFESQALRASHRTPQEQVGGMLPVKATGHCSQEPESPPVLSWMAQFRLQVMCGVLNQCDVDFEMNSPSMRGAMAMLQLLGQRAGKGTVVWLPVNRDFYHNHVRDFAQWEANLNGVKNHLQTVAHDAGVAFIDLSAVSLSQADFYDRLHMNASGTLKTAAACQERWADLK